jgi:uncharacterized coiled-coil protein SlyX
VGLVVGLVTIALALVHAGQKVGAIEEHLKQQDATLASQDKALKAQDDVLDAQDKALAALQQKLTDLGGSRA